VACRLCLLLGLLLFGSPAQAQLGQLPGRPPAQASSPGPLPGGTLITNFVVGNTSGGTITNPRVSFEQPFALGDIPSGYHVEVRANDGVTVEPCQQDQESTWAQDGSYKAVAISCAFAGSLKARQQVTYQIWSVFGPPNKTANVSIAQILANSDFKVQLTGGSFGSDVWQASVNDVLANATAFPWGANPIRGWTLTRSGPYDTEYHTWALLKRVSDSAPHKWLYADIWVRAWSTSVYEVGGIVRQSNVFGPHPSGTVGANPQPGYQYQGTLLNGVTVLRNFGGSSDYRTFTLAPSAFNTSTHRITTVATNPIIANQQSAGVPVRISSSGSLPTGISAATTYWLSWDGLSSTSAFLAPPRIDASNVSTGQPGTTINFSTQGSGTITITPLLQTFPYTGTHLLDAGGHRLWVGATRSPVLVAKNFSYLTQKSKGVPPYLPGITVHALPSAATASYSQGSMMFPWDINTTGDSASDQRIGYLFLQGARTLYAPLDPKMDQSARAFALSQGETHMWLINEGTGQPPVMNTHPGAGPYANLGANQDNNRAYPYNSDNTPAWSSPSAARIYQDGIQERYGPWLDPSHMPIAWLGPYLASGDDIFRWDGVQLSNMSNASTYSGILFTPDQYYHLQVGLNQTRGMGWGLRAKTEVYNKMPASDPLYAYWFDTIKDEANGLNSWLANVGGSGDATADKLPLGWWNLINSNSNEWEDSIFALSLGMETWRSEVPGFGAWMVAHYNKQIIGQIDSTFAPPPGPGCLWTIGPHWIQPFSGTPGASPLLTNWNAVFTRTAALDGGIAWPNPWPGTCPAGLGPDPDSTTIDEPNSIVNFRTSALGLLSASGIAPTAAGLYSRMRVTQYAHSPPLSFTDYPTWAIGPLGAPN
jgi:hypothetical protein